jgi:hypothetical protein
MQEKDLVFLGYSREPDEAFAVQLADWLRRCSLDVWLDLERIPKGHKPQPLIEKALTTSRRAVFLVSKDWLDRDWTQFELSRFVQLDAQRARVAIIRGPDIAGRLPPELSLSRPIVWTDAEVAPEARFWEVYCALSGTPPGPPGKWKARGEEALARRSTGMAAAPPAPPVVTTVPPPPAPSRRKHLRTALLAAAGLALAVVVVRQITSQAAPAPNPEPPNPNLSLVEPRPRQQEQPPPPPPPAKSLVQVKVNVPARILVDGQEVAALAAEVAVELPVGQHRLRVEAPRAKAHEQTFVNTVAGANLAVQLVVPPKQKKPETTGKVPWD